MAEMAHKTAGKNTMLRPMLECNGLSCGKRSKPAPTPRPKPETPDLLRSIPAELRNEIYELTLQFAETLPVIHMNARRSKDRKKYAERIGLFGVSKNIRREALSFYCGTNIVFHINAFTMVQFQRVADWLRGIVSMWGIKVFSSFKLRVQGAVWQNLQAMLPLLEFMRETGFWPYTEADLARYQSAVRSQEYRELRDAASCSMFIMQSEDCVRAQQVLEEAASLAHEANLKGWDQQRLAAEFERFVKENVSYGRGRAAVLQGRRRVKKRLAREKQAASSAECQTESIQEVAVVSGVTDGD